VAGERLVSVLALFISSCKWHSTVQTQLLIAAHGKYSAGVWLSVRLLYRTTSYEYGACLMATNCIASDKITQQF
jgi:hypothetical protein